MQKSPSGIRAKSDVVSSAVHPTLLIPHDCNLYPSDKVNAESIASLALYIGTSYDKDTKKSGVKMLAQTFKRHPKFDNVESDEGTTPIFDVAVIRLKGAVTPGATIAVIAITKAHAEPRTGSKLDIAGWGITAVSCWLRTPHSDL